MRLVTYILIFLFGFAVFSSNQQDDFCGDNLGSVPLSSFTIDFDQPGFTGESEQCGHEELAFCHCPHCVQFSIPFLDFSLAFSPNISLQTPYMASLSLENSFPSYRPPSIS